MPAQVAIRQEAVPVEPGAAYAKIRLTRRQRAGQGDLDLPVFAIAHACHNAPLQFVRGFARCYVDRAAHRVAAVQSALGTLQDFNLLQVQQRLVELVGTRLQHPVHGNRHRRLIISDLSNAPDRQECGPGILCLHQCHVRNKRQVIIGAPDSGILNVGPRKGVNGNGNFQQAFAPETRGYDDLLNHVGSLEVVLLWGCTRRVTQADRDRKEPGKKW